MDDALVGSRIPLYVISERKVLAVWQNTLFGKGSFYHVPAKENIRTFSFSSFKSRKDHLLKISQVFFFKETAFSISEKKY